MGGSDDNGLLGFVLFALGPGAGVAVWMWIQGHYRNRSARYQPESVVHHRVLDLRAHDQLIRRLRSRSPSISGGNELQPDARARAWRVIETPVEAPPRDAAVADADEPGDIGPDDAAVDGAGGDDAAPRGQARPPA